MSENIPKHVAIIMDGNGRWAQKRGLKRINGHKEGTKALRKVSEYLYGKGIKILSVYAFSTENWKRDKEEVDYLMKLFLTAFNNNFEELKAIGIKVIFSGLKDRLNDKVLSAMKKMEEDTKNNRNGIFNICLNYGGQDEIVNATRRIVNDVNNGVIKSNNINKDLFNKYLFNDLPPIDFMIRTSGEYRISNFMLWQLAYSELYFTNTLWPDFDEKEVDKALESYNNRDRRFGGIKK